MIRPSQVPTRTSAERPQPAGADPAPPNAGTRPHWPKASYLCPGKGVVMTHSPRRQPPRRQRALDACTAKLLKLLGFLEAVEIETAAAAWHVSVNTVHQAACRLRKAGLPVRTRPGPPYNQHTGGADYYFITEDWLDYAATLREIWSGDLIRDLTESTENHALSEPRE